MTEFIGNIIFIIGFFAVCAALAKIYEKLWDKLPEKVKEKNIMREADRLMRGIPDDEK